MRVTFLGTGSAMPVSGRAQTGLLLESDTHALLVDCGSGVLARLAETEVGYEGISSVLLTHLHLDHVSDLMPLVKARWLAGEEYLEIVGPEGTKALVDGLFDVHDYLKGRLEIRVREVGPHEFGITGFDVLGYEVRHSIPTLAYRFTHEMGESDFVFSGDTEAFDGLAEFADGASVLVHDCSFPDDVDVSNHPTPSKVGETLAGYDIDRVILTHLYPHADRVTDNLEARVSDHFDGDVQVAEDGLVVEF
ncbi:MBL fold metallo-hydrolase [Haloferax mediterranei ATCC 33500]|uniref:MBL fold metallo-hydrolase n=1 Tax=Haloferax mediterranei (strain ATCC 33500 / DSM 1411 / JCM 8866 / NBRC 14739 / NCIMB 2177 / R-4) TaxID=523841 RepID=I3R891_HALMT|nr:MBL fold metallo-hydrolase [Haloferax mediterranei]AFK20451.1 ribonuclease Z (RNase Z) (tRNA 3 endonuclease) [Haloferax mediterranei ATCC 33500]AHZ23812.1 ribonuclease Z [Haloferax mediterranei ATCC 33500]ELZ98235.1 ribonuclease Z [Haloferax mediterranei ATCC 33500]MDX5986793.1 MBL fold metallo-hydrolase [Haloferax mediterranei ATCC 33500]QCQ76117.1 MBL fold metallo-hydrolase [Haloferax mediterranei ATCC 33500]